MNIKETNPIDQTPPDSGHEQLEQTLGQLLKSTRQAKNITAQEIADKLYLKLIVIQDIDNDQVDPSVNPLFSKGYIANYAKLVGLEPKPILQLFNSQYQPTTQVKGMQSFSQRTKVQLHNRYLNWVTMLIVGGFVAMIVIWWWQQADNDQPEQASVNIAAEQLDDSMPLVVADQKSQSELTSTSANDGIKNTKLDLDFSQDCWIKITDASNEVLAIGMKKAGSVLTVSGMAPLQVTLGAPAAVSITYQGEALDISRYIIDNAARFSVPLEQ
ncbi:MAG: DUF4115 domain-containing protein [Gammaproteobacteria bacterium]|nr:DUF4115 domain-containing protein [Gammaproteobacteria bacterium]